MLQLGWLKVDRSYMNKYAFTITITIILFCLSWTVVLEFVEMHGPAENLCCDRSIFLPEQAA